IQALSPPLPSPPTPPRDIPGVDTAQGLARLRHNAAAYRDLLGTFDEDHRRDLECLEALLAGGEHQRAAALVHALKGAAGNVGAVALHAAARDLEAALASGGDFHSPLAQVAAEHRRVFAGLEVLRGPTAPATPPSGEAGTLDSDALGRALDDLAALIDARSFDAPRGLEAVEASLAGHMTEPYGALRRAVEHFDFEGARDLVDRLRALERPDDAPATVGLAQSP
ncbi:MAG: Hpt domain-containing protein, partial [Candidatus Competibacterales bacterium]